MAQVLLRIQPAREPACKLQPALLYNQQSSSAAQLALRLSTDLNGPGLFCTEDGKRTHDLLST